jgi:hypothetical protein
MRRQSSARIENSVVSFDDNEPNQDEIEIDNATVNNWDDADAQLNNGNQVSNKSQNRQKYLIREKIEKRREQQRLEKETGEIYDDWE